MSVPHPNSLEAIRERWKAGRVSTAAALLSLPLRVLICLAAQAAAAVVVSLLGAAEPWLRAAELWPLYGTAANLVTLWIVARFLRSEGIPFAALWSADAVNRRHDRGAAAAAAVIGILLVLASHAALTALLFESAAAPLAWLHINGPWFQRWGFAVLYISSGTFAVYPLFLGFAVPRLATVSGLRNASVFLGMLWLGAQYISLPFVADWRYLVWRLVLFMPLAWVFSATVLKRPGSLRYLMIAYVVIHVVLLIVLEETGLAALPNYPI